MAKNESKFSLLSGIPGNDLLSKENPADVSEPKVLVNEEALSAKPALKKFVIPSKRNQVEKSGQFVEKVIMEEQSQELKAVDERFKDSLRIGTLDLGEREVTVPGNDLLSKENPADVSEPKVLVNEEALSAKPALKKFVIPSKRNQVEKSVQFVEKVIMEEQSQELKAVDERFKDSLRIGTLDLGEREVTVVISEDGLEADAGNKESEDDGFEKPEPPRPKLTLEEWKAQQKPIDDPHFNIRHAGEGCTKRIQHKMEKFASVERPEKEFTLSETKKCLNKKAGNNGKRRQHQKTVPADFLFQAEKKGPVRERREAVNVPENRCVGQNRAATECTIRQEGSSILNPLMDDVNWRNRGQKQREVTKIDDFEGDENDPKTSEV